MSYGDALRHHVERSVRRDLGFGPLQPDPGGDYALDVNDSVVWVAPMLAEQPPLVRVWSTAATGVKSSKALLTELNEANAGLRQVRCLLRGPAVLIAAEIEVESIASGELGRLVRRVAGTARHVGEPITAVYGGEVARSMSAREDAVADE